ncbi:MAG: prepilin-type N-terminal cleavage/methylation domain-containing protein [Polyangiaceae bacterium]
MTTPTIELPPPYARPRRAVRGLTLIEVMVVVVVIGLFTTAVLAGSGQLSSAKLRRAAVTVTSGIRVAFTRATSRSKSVRVVFDMDQNGLWLEEGSQPMLIQPKDETGTGGADPATEAEKAAAEEAARIVKGPQAPKPSFTPITDLGFEDPETGKGVKELGRIKIRQVQTAHDDEPKTKGRGYLYFWPGGQTERAAIQLSIGDSKDDADTVTLFVSPLTGKVTVKPGAIDLPSAKDDKSASEREDPGGF